MFAQGSYAATPIVAPTPTGTERLYSLAAALDAISEGAIFLNAEGQLIWHNHAFDTLLVENREGHLLGAAVIESAADFYLELDEARALGRLNEEPTVRDVTVGRI